MPIIVVMINTTTTHIIVERILFTKLTSKNILLTVAKMGKKRTGINERNSGWCWKKNASIESYLVAQQYSASND